LQSRLCSESTRICAITRCAARSMPEACNRPFGLVELLLFACKQLQWAEKVYAVYEAGPLGYVLYRRLMELGVEAMVCAPESLEAGEQAQE